MPNVLEDAWNAFFNWANQQSEQYIEAQIPKERTDLTGPDAALTPFRDYLRLWLDDMFLAMGKEWFVDRFPAVHTSVELKFGGNPAIMAAIGMLSGFCGTLTTPMAANFNLVPAALLGLEDRYAVIKAQIPTAIAVLLVNTVLMYALVFRF